MAGRESSTSVVIVGGGLEGMAAAWALADRGITDVLVCERGTVGGGMTGKSSGIVRCHYGVGSLAAMAAISLEVFENAVDIFGDDIGFRQTGYVVGVGESNADSLRRSLAAQREVGVQTEEIDATAVAAMWPAADLDDFASFGWEERGGYGDAYQTAQAFAASARAAGSTIRQGAEVMRIIVEADRAVGVELSDGQRISAEVIVAATGVWTPELLAPLGLDIPIQVHREQIVLIDSGAVCDGLPVFSDLVSLQYVRPEGHGQLLFGNSDLAQLSIAHPDNYRNRADEEFMELAAEKVGGRFPGFGNAAIASSYAGCYDVTPDWNPIISPTPIDGLLVAAGFSGHGFKLAPAVGRLVADLIVDGHSREPRIPEADFRWSRFAEGRPLNTRFPYVGAGEMR